MKQRLDKFLVEKKYIESRTKAIQYIENGNIFVNNESVKNKSFLVSENDQIQINFPSKVYVSIGGYKLEKAIQNFTLNLDEKTVLDIGASTGGFTDCAIQYGASFVLAVDVGTNQMHPSLLNNPKVNSLEKTDFRSITPEKSKEKYFDFVVIDVSFISLSEILPYIKLWLKYKGEVIALLKPQFEQNQKKKFKNGIIKDKYIHQNVIKTIKTEIEKNQFILKSIISTDADGKTKNIEYLLHIVQP